MKTIKMFIAAWLLVLSFFAQAAQGARQYVLNNPFLYENRQQPFPQRQRQRVRQGNFLMALRRQMQRNANVAQVNPQGMEVPETPPLLLANAAELPREHLLEEVVEQIQEMPEFLVPVRVEFDQQEQIRLEAVADEQLVEGMEGLHLQPHQQAPAPENEQRPQRDQQGQQQDQRRLVRFPRNHRAG